jgi:rubrerythrin
LVWRCPLCGSEVDDGKDCPLCKMSEEEAQLEATQEDDEDEEF